jgi:hypothetical protein
MQLRTVSRVLAWIVVATVACPAQQPIAQASQRRSTYGQLPLTFEANRGQTDPQVKFLSHGKGYTAFLTAGGLVLSLRPVEVPQDAHILTVSAANRPQPPRTTLELRLVGAAQTSTVIGEDPQPGKVNYFFGNNPAKWRTNVPTYARVRCKNVYPGIDLVYYGSHHELEYDFEISPGADPNKIQFEVKGARQIRIDGQGNLVLQTGSGELRFKSPIIYQEAQDQRIAVDGRYRLRDSAHVTFRVSHYERNKALVIDPVLVYSTYLGGSGNDQPRGIAVDSAGDVYIAGFTDSVDFPGATLGSLPAAATHVFVAKLDATGSHLVYADYLGGNSQDYGYALALDSANDVYVTGSTASSDFPVVNPFQGTYPGAFNTFLSKISPDGSALLYSTYLGGNGSDIPSGIAVDSSGDMILGGYTSSTNFPVANAYQPTVSPNQGGMYGDYGFLTKFTPDGSSLIYSTYLGGNSNVPLNCGGTPCWPQPVSAVNGMALDAAGNAYAAGITNTYNFPVTSGAYLTTDSTQLNSTVGFVSKFNESGALQYSTYFYESSGLLTNINAIATDASGAAYVTGIAISDGSFPLTSTSICDPAVYGWGCGYAFVTKFDPTGSTLSYSTFLGPNNYASPAALLVDANNDAYVLASTSSNSFGTINAIESFNSGNDFLLTEIDPSGTSELWATYLGGNLDDNAAAIASDSKGNLYVTGFTSSTDFPATQGAFQNTSAGNTDAVVLKISSASAPAIAMNPASLQYALQQVGSASAPQQVLLRNMGSAPLSISSTLAVGDFSETDDCGTSVPAAGTCQLSVTFIPTAAGPRTGSISIKDDAAGSPHVIPLSGDAFTGAVAGVAPTSLTFPNVPRGSSSAPLTASLSSTGTATLHITSIQVTGDYSQTNNCGSILAAGSSCTISLIFAPTTSGSRGGTLTVNDDADTNPQTIPLVGTGSDFSLSAAPSSVTVKSGTTATYVLTVSSVGGSFPSAIALACSGLPAKAACTLSPNSVMPTGNQGTSTLTITTTSTSAQLLPLQPTSRQWIYALWLQLPGFGLFGLMLTGPGRRPRKLRCLILPAVVASLMLMSACAGGTGIVRQGGSGTPPGSYTITVTGTANSVQHSLALILKVQ